MFNNQITNNFCQITTLPKISTKSLQIRKNNQFIEKHMSNAGPRLIIKAYIFYYNIFVYFSDLPTYLLILILLLL